MTGQNAALRPGFGRRWLIARESSLSEPARPSDRQLKLSEERMTGDDTELRPEIDREDRSAGSERILSIDSEHLDRLFAVLLFLFFGTLIAMTPQYSPDSRLFPLVIGIPSFVLFGALLLLQSSSRFADLVGRFEVSDMFEFEERFGDDSREGIVRGSGGETDALLVRRKRLINITLWMVLLFGLIVLVGFLPATVLFLLGFYRLYTSIGWVRSVSYTVIFTALIVVIFGVVMGMRFYEGILGINIPI